MLQPSKLKNTAAFVFGLFLLFCFVLASECVYRAFLVSDKNLEKEIDRRKERARFLVEKEGRLKTEYEPTPPSLNHFPHKHTNKNGFETHFTGKYLGESRNLGWVLRSHVNIRSQRFFDNQLVYEYNLKTDQYGRRYSGKYKKISENSFVLLGDSQAVGQGLFYGETIAGRLNSENEKWTVYNYGVYGYSLAHILRQVELRNWKKEVPEKHGYIFLFYFQHLQDRMFLYGMTREWMPRVPHYKIKNNQLVLDGFFRERYGSWAHRFLYKNSYLYKYEIDRGIQHTKKHNQMACLTVQQIQSFLKEKLSGHKFRLIWMPQFPDQNDIRSCLNKASVDVWDFGDLLSKYPDAKVHFKDGHFTAFANKKTFEALQDKVTSELKSP